jgi:predicted peroxiredoxin
MHSYLFMLTHGEAEASAATVRRCLRLAKLALVKGRAVTLFLMDDAVTLARRMPPKVLEPFPTPCRDEIDVLLNYLREAGADIYLETKSARDKLACTTLPEGVVLRHEAKFIDMAEDAKVFSF